MYESDVFLVFLSFLHLPAFSWLFVGFMIFHLCLRSIRHLQEASNTDGKAAINLQKLKLFRHFYIMVIILFLMLEFVVLFRINSLGPGY